jgi:segregation and condensation protein A
MNADNGTLEINIFQYEGPLDLLSQLIDKNRVPVDRVSIASIADQYLEIIHNSAALDMELASTFLLMAATLIHLKSSLLLPDQRRLTDTDETDPGDLLIMRLLQYRRCKALAASLRERYVQCGRSFGKSSEPPERVGIERERETTSLERARFDLAVEAVTMRNDVRFYDSAEEVGQILERERISLHERMAFIVRQIAGRTRVFFYELFPPELPTLERVTGFLAVLELVFQRKVKVKQKSSFAPILIERETSRSSRERGTA